MPYFTKRLPVLKTNEKWREARREMWQETLLYIWQQPDQRPRLPVTRAPTSATGTLQTVSPPQAAQ